MIDIRMPRRAVLMAADWLCNPGRSTLLVPALYRLLADKAADSSQTRQRFQAALGGRALPVPRILEAHSLARWQPVFQYPDRLYHPQQRDSHAFACVSVRTRPSFVMVVVDAAGGDIFSAGGLAGLVV